jgi:hypothetical protein
MQKLIEKIRMFLVIAAAAQLSIVSLAAQAPLPVPQQPPAVGVPQPVPQSAPVVFASAELERVVSPIALYPDPLLAQILTAATFADQIPAAAQWADQHHYLTGGSLAAAIAGDRLPWEPSVQALLPFPSVLDMMASDMPWTQELGNAFLAQPAQVMDAVQGNRQQAVNYGYLRSNAQVTVVTGPDIEIVPVNPDYIVVPYYDPLIVFAPPRRGIAVGTAVRFGFGVTLGAPFVPWGWHATRFEWRNHAVIVNNTPWRRTWANRSVYVHPYSVPRYAAPPVEQHRTVVRSAREREAERSGHGYREEHRGEEHHGEEHRDSARRFIK